MVLRLLMVLMLCFPAAAGAEQLTGDAAWRYIGDLQRKLTGNAYSAIELTRRNRNPQTAGFVDALVCVPGQASYRSLRQQDDNHVLLISEPGRGPLRARTVAAQSFAYYQKLILDNRLKPVVVLAAGGREAGIVFCGIDNCTVAFQARADGSLYLEIKDAASLFDKKTLRVPVAPDFPGASE